MKKKWLYDTSQLLALQNGYIIVTLFPRRAILTLWGISQGKKYSKKINSIYVTLFVGSGFMINLFQIVKFMKKKWFYDARHLLPF